MKNNRVIYTKPTVLEPTILLQLPPVRCFSHLHASQNGSLALIDDDGIEHVYQQTDNASEPICDIKLVAENPASGPEYLTRRQRVKREIKQAIQRLMKLFYVFRKLMLLVQIPFFMVLLSIIMTVTSIYLYSRYVGTELLPTNYEDLSDFIAGACQQRQSEPHSIGFKYLHLSVCLESAHTEPVDNCVHSVKLDSGEHVNIIDADPKCFSNQPIPINLRTFLRSRSGNGSYTFCEVEIIDGDG